MEDCPDLCTPSEPVRGSAEPSEPHIPVAIIGAGPAGLTAAYELARRGIPCVVLEELGKVGGLARTEAQNGFLFDIGGHRFYSKVAAVKQFWHDMLGVDFLCRARQSRIYSNGQYYQYPLRPWEALTKLGVIESLRCIISYLATKFRSRQPAVTLEDWLVSSFGRRLYERFFRTYTEKVWGRPCRELSAEWAAQRIQGMSLAGALKDALGLGGRAKDGYKSLIKEFHYPRRGPGMLWEEVRRRAEAGGAQVVTDARVDRIQWAEGSLRAVRAGGRWYRAEHFLSTMPIRDLIGALDPPVPELARAADQFRYRDFLMVALMLRCPSPFPDNWIYVHDPSVRVGRIQNFGNWSPDMVPDPSMTSLGMEYFCNQGDELWSQTDAGIVALARQELGQLGLADPGLVFDAAVLRVPKAYPVYDGAHQKGLAAVKVFLHRVPNLQLIGRNGMHRYNNQDHSMLTAMLAVRNILGARFDLWKVNADQDYHEDGF